MLLTYVFERYVFPHFHFSKDTFSLLKIMISYECEKKAWKKNSDLKGTRTLTYICTYINNCRQHLFGFLGNNCNLSTYVPCTEVNFAWWVNHHAHILTRHKMILDAFDVEEVSIWSPENLGGVHCHVEWCRRIMLESWVEPPLTEKYVHGVVLFLKKRKVSFITIINSLVYWLDWTLTSILLIIKW